MFEIRFESFNVVFFRITFFDLFVPSFRNHLIFLSNVLFSSERFPLHHSFFFGVFVGNRAGDANVEAVLHCFLRGFKSSVE